ncbi:MAG: GAF domain-containing protein [Chloroflexi bacterium]|nr:GAF domain-containing protein [Chloroflexota bacterium]
MGAVGSAQVETPITDSARLAVLRRTKLLDTGVEEAFDRLTRLATRVLDVPIALVSLVDAQRQFFKSAVGLTEPWASRRETPLSHSFCQHVVVSGQPFVVVDAREHPLVRENLAIRDLGVIAYAGMPLATKQGDVLGSFCAIRPNPHEWTADQLDLLRDLAAAATTEIELRLELAEAERLHGESQAVLDAIREAIVMIGADGRQVRVNGRFGELFGLAKRPGEPIAAAELLPALAELFDEPGEIGRLLGDQTDPRQPTVTIVRQRYPKSRKLELFAATVATEAAEPHGRLYVFRDVTREREVDRTKNAFIAQVSHEFRTPLTSIKGYVDLLLEGAVGELTPEQEEFLGVVASNSARLSTLIDDLLDLARIESGKIELRCVDLDLRLLVQAAAQSLRPQIDAKQQSLTVSCSAQVPHVWGDAGRVLQILTNLLSNAHKYTPVGGRLSVSLETAGDQVRVAVADTGIGLSPEEQAQLFTQFFRANRDQVREARGTGLGLAITRSLVELHGGAITYSSELGAGSTFTVVLPIHAADGESTSS